MQWTTGLQSYYFIADPEVGKQQIWTKNSKCNSFPVTIDLLNSDTVKEAIAQLCNELQLYNFTMLQLTEDVSVTYIKRKYCKCNSFQVTSNLLNSDNLKVAIAPLCNRIQVCNFTML